MSGNRLFFLHVSHVLVNNITLLLFDDFFSDIKWPEPITSQYQRNKYCYLLHCFFFQSISLNFHFSYWTQHVGVSVFHGDHLHCVHNSGKSLFHLRQNCKMCQTEQVFFQTEIFHGDY